MLMRTAIQSLTKFVYHVDSDELQLKDECDKAWIVAWLGFTSYVLICAK